MAYHLINIGISAYSNPANNLDFPDADAGELSAIMRHSLGDELTYDVLLRDSEATQIGIRTALGADELKKASSNDTLSFTTLGMELWYRMAALQRLTLHHTMRAATSQYLASLHLKLRPYLMT